MNLIFIRHGQTDLNYKRAYQGRINTSINQNGIKHAKELKNKLKKFNIDKVYTSPLKRAKETLNIVLEDKNIDFVMEDRRIEEIDFGVWDTIQYEKVNINYKKEYKEFLNDYENFTFPKGESFKDFYNRCSDFLDDIIDPNSNETVLVVTHGGVIRAFLCYILKLPKNMFYSFSVKQGCYIKVIVVDKINVIDELNK